jgi:hypothetical protein
MAASHTPPLVSGDGALSAALILGRPFVMTHTSFNERIVDQVAERVSRLVDTPEARQAVQAALHDLENTARLETPEIRSAYARFSRETRRVTDQVLEALRVGGELEAPLPSSLQAIEERVRAIRDPLLRYSYLKEAARQGSAPAERLLISLLRSDAPLFHLALLDGILSPDQIRRMRGGRAKLRTFFFQHTELIDRLPEGTSLRELIQILSASDRLRLIKHLLDGGDEWTSQRHAELLFDLVESTHVELKALRNSELNQRLRVHHQHSDSLERLQFLLALGEDEPLARFLKSQASQSRIFANLRSFGRLRLRHRLGPLSEEALRDAPDTPLARALLTANPEIRGAACTPLHHVIPHLPR